MLSDEDKEKISHALKFASLSALAKHDLGSLSGGQRQRVWIAMALTQDSEIILLDEPTTFLDMAHQLDVMQLLSKVNTDHQKTIIMVLHDLNQAARFADYIIAIRQGKIIRQGTANEIMCAEVMRDVLVLRLIFLKTRAPENQSVCPMRRVWRKKIRLLKPLKCGNYFCQ